MTQQGIPVVHDGEDVKPKSVSVSGISNAESMVDTKIALLAAPS